MLIQECVEVGIRELSANKVRTFLSIFGIIIGIISLMVMMGIMNGVERTWVKYTEEMGGLEKAVITSKVPSVDGHERLDLKRPLTIEDADLIHRNPMVRYVSPEIQTFQYVSYFGKKKRVTTVLGGTRSTLNVARQKIAKGRNLAGEDISKSRYVCLLGTAVRDDLFGPNTNPIGENIEIGGQLFEVIGILEKNILMKKGQNLIEAKNDIIYIPVTAVSAKLRMSKEIQQIQYTVRKRSYINAAAKQITDLLAQSHRIDGDVNVQTLEESYLKSKKSFDILKTSFSFIAGISLVVGGVGIMNIMIASIVQRVREIGIRKAVGATFEDILFQFLVETVIVSCLGGIIGIFLSFFIVFMIQLFVAELDPIITFGAVIVSAIFSFLVGMCSGIYPAIKAARLNPIEALHYQ